MKWWHRRRTEAECARRLRAVCADLRELNQSTEGDFLTVLAGLRGFLDRARGLSADCGALAEALRGKDAAAAEQALAKALEGTSSEHAGGQDSAILAQATFGLGQLETQVKALHGTVRMFRVLATSIRIERGRLGPAGIHFDDLADHVGQLAEDLEKHCLAILATCASVSGTWQAAVASLDRMEARRRDNLPLILRSAAQGIETLRLQREQTAGLSAALETEFQAVSRDIGELVSSLQYHDITRQRVEHTAEALAEAAAGLGGPAAVAGLQHAQLLDTRTEFAAATARIGVALRDMAGRVSGMARRTAGALAGDGAGHTAFFAALEADCRAVIAGVQDFADTTLGLVVTAASVQLSIAPVREMAGAIDEIGVRMLRLSLVASLKAAHMQGDGAALSALAEAIRQTAAEAGSRAETVIASIREITECAAGLERQAVTRHERVDWERHAQAGLEQAVEELRHGGTEAAERIPRLFQAAEALAADISTMAQGGAAVELFAMVTERCLATLAGIAGESSHSQDVARLRARYTMETERAVHDSLMGSDTGGAVAQESGVELF